MYFLKNLFRNIKSDIQYSIKLIRSVASGFDGLEHRYGDGLFYPLEADDQSQDPYYVCVSFKNGRHLPLPIVTDGRSEYWMQNLVMWLLWFSPPLRQARSACRAYEMNYQALKY